MEPHSEDYYTSFNDEKGGTPFSPSSKGGGKWVLGESGMWIPDIRAAVVHMNLWAAFDLILKLDAKMCTDFSKTYRSWFEYDSLTHNVVEFKPTDTFQNLSKTDYFRGTILERQGEAGKWNQNDVELTRREIIHYKMQPTLPLTTAPTGAETWETDLTGLRGLRMQSERLVFRGLVIMARNYWFEALSRFKSNDFNKIQSAKKREKRKFKMRRVMRKLCQKLELISMLMPHPNGEVEPPCREILDLTEAIMKNLHANVFQ